MLRWVLLAAAVAYAEYVPPGPKFRCPAGHEVLLHPCVCTAESDFGVDLICEKSNLAGIAVGLGQLYRFNSTVYNLTLTNNNIGRLHGAIFHKIQARNLVLKNMPIIEMEESVFLGINSSLEYLEIVNTNLSYFPSLATHVLGSVLELKLDGNQISTLDGKTFGESALGNNLLKLSITGSELNKFPPDTFQTLRKLKKLDLQRNQIGELARNQFKNLRDLEFLDLSYNNIQKLDASNFADLTKLGWLNVSHNNLKELTRGTFARNAVLKSLNMSYNKIKKLDANSFRGMRFMRRLYFSDNIIEDVGRGTFATVSRIGTIDLARNLIKKIDYQMFFQLNYVEIIDVSSNAVTEIQKLAFKDLYLVTINLNNNSISKIELGAFENCANITFLDMSFNRISELPARSFDENTYASHLYLPFNNLTSLKQIPLQNMTGLKILNASYNSIETIPKNSFPKLYELHTIDLSHNNLTTIFNGVFQVLFSLRFLDLSHNQLKIIKSSVFGSLPTLLELKLSHNQLEEISRGALTRLASVRKIDASNNHLATIFQIPISLSELNFSKNKLSEIPLNVWPTMNALLSLDLSENQLVDKGLQKGAFANLLSLSNLLLHHNQLTEPPKDALSDLPSLQYLDLHGNKLKSLTKNAFGRLPIVFELNLAENQIETVSIRAFEGLLQLLVLNLSSNGISSLPNGVFQGLVSLRTLDLSHNALEKLDNKTHGLLEDCLSLERVNLSGNHISFITRKSFPSSPYIPYRLQEIDLSYNTMPVVTLELTVGTEKLRKLNLSRNTLNEIRPGVIEKLSSLEELDLSFNQLSEIENISSKNLSKLFITGNKLKSLEVSNAKRIALLDVRMNYFLDFPDRFLKPFRNGVNIFFQDNPIICDCKMLPFRRALLGLKSPEKFDLKCQSPEYLNGKLISTIPETELACFANFHHIDEETKVTPDLRFRDFQLKKGELSARWYVTSKSDISDFYFVIEEDNNETHNVIFEKLIAYDVRSLVISEKEISFRSKSQLPKSIRFCLLAVDSSGAVGDPFPDQCKTYPISTIISYLTSSAFSFSLQTPWIFIYLYAAYIYLF